MGKKHRFDHRKFVVEPEDKLNLSKRSTTAGKELNDKELAAETLAADVSELQKMQELLYASNTYALLVIIQGMDTSGKDGTIRHVMGGINPQGCRVYSFKAPNDLEREHHFLWRAAAVLPERGMISLFNRSYYEEVVTVRVHPEFLIAQRLPSLKSTKAKSLEKLWKQRYKEIVGFEQTLIHNGTAVLKFFLHISPGEQKQRLLKRLQNPEKHWKFNAQDLAERKLWPDYEAAFEDALSNTSTADAPWYVIPADDKWYARAAVADIIAARLESLELSYPAVAKDEQFEFDRYIQQLEEE